MNYIDNLSANELAVECAQAMWAQDSVSRNLGMKLGSVSPGRTEVSMVILDNMLNGHKICHGGYIFMLADAAFAYACNSHNQNCVAQHCDISFLKQAKGGEILTANAVERILVGRTGIYDITVTNANAEIIAEFRGISRTIKGKFISPQNTQGGDIS